MEHDHVSDGLCDDRLLADPPATPTRPPPSFSLPRRAREPVAVPTPTRRLVAVAHDRPDKYSQPTQPQKRALFSLARFDPWKVTAWVEIVQSLKPGYQHSGGLTPLTPSDLSAVHELKDCEKDWLLAWLKVAAQSWVIQPSPTPQTFALQPLASPRGYSSAFQPAFSTPARTSASSLHPSSAFSLQSVQSTLPSTLSNVTSCSQPSAIDQGSPASSKTGEHLHWCNICEHPKGIEKCDGYKRHMREHETIYTCMPNGPVRDTEAGEECYFCGASNPDQTHWATHGVSKCYGQYAKRQSYTRKINLHNHIKDIHNTSEDRASALAKAWVDPHKNKRKFFSCGFCISCFPTLVKKSNHIDLEHWKKHQELKEWDNDKVILGLLLQPGVKEKWHQLLMSAGIDPKLDPQFNPAPLWVPSVVEDVQLQLEIGEDSAASLAGLAFEKSSYYFNYQAKISNGTFQSYDQGVDIYGHPSLEQNAIDTMQLPNQEFLQISGDSSINDNRFRASHEHLANSYHGEASGFGQALPDIEHRRLQSTIGLYEDIATNCQQKSEFHDHSSLFDLDPSGATIGSVIDLETPSSAPWSAYTVSKRPDLAQNPMLSEVLRDIPASYDPIRSGMYMDIASNRSADQPKIDLQQHDSPPSGNLSSSVAEATPYVPARRKSFRPKVIGGSKRKLSGSPGPESRWDRETNPIVVEMGRGSRDHRHDDHLRSKKRIEGYNDHDR